MKTLEEFRSFVAPGLAQVSDKLVARALWSLIYTPEVSEEEIKEALRLIDNRPAVRDQVTLNDIRRPRMKTKSA